MIQMIQKVVKCGVKKQENRIYFVDMKGDVSSMALNGTGPTKIMKCGIRQQQGYFYFVDDKGDVSRIEAGNISSYPSIEKQFNSLRELGELPESCRGYTIEDKKKIIEVEERKKLEEQRLRYEVRKKLMEEEFKDLAKDGRERIPEEVRHEVWRRDGGKCVKCGNRENIEFDHIVPISKGGSNTARNIELLCEKCNREKSNNIG